jgi:UDP-N-acetylmuramate--alanine ligase
LEGFAASFEDADSLILLPIYPARETDTLGVSATDVVDAMNDAVSPPSDVRVAESMEQAVGWLKDAVRPDDVVLTLGAGDGDWVGERLLGWLRGESCVKE